MVYLEKRNANLALGEKQMASRSFRVFGTRTDLESVFYEFQKLNLVKYYKCGRNENKIDDRLRSSISSGVIARFFSRIRRRSSVLSIVCTLRFLAHRVEHPEPQENGDLPRNAQKVDFPEIIPEDQQSGNMNGDQESPHDGGD